MKFNSILNELHISKWTALFTLVFGGWADLAKLICEAFTKLLRKADPAKLKKYAEMTAKIATCLRGIVEIFVPQGKVRDAAVKTVEAVETLAEHLEDGEYTTEELDIDVDNIRACIDAWVKTAEDEEEKSEDDCPNCHV